MSAADPTALARTVFSSTMPTAERYHDLLAGPGIARGLLGPREAERLWDRHLVNCAVLTELLPEGARVVDVGSGAGLPGLVLAVRRSDLSVDLVESLQRRVEFLTEVVEELELGPRVRVVRGRAEDATVISTVGSAEWVTARAVAPLDRLVRWCLPLLRPGGQLLAIKGATAGAEVAQHRSAMIRSGAEAIDIVRCGVGIVADPVTVVSIRRAGRPPAVSRPASGKGPHDRAV